jgi:hypothetical protein
MQKDSSAKSAEEPEKDMMPPSLVILCRFIKETKNTLVMKRVVKVASGMTL